MRPVITPTEAKRLDDTSEIPVATLMERAGLGVALAAVRLGARYGSRVVVLAGPGNNGGDGYVAARLLRDRGVDVEVRALGYPRGDWSAARRAAIAAVKAGIRVEPLKGIEPADLVVDALFGAGFHGSLPPSVLPWLDHPGPVLAVDLPSGLDGSDGSVADRAFVATATVTFDAAKVGHQIGSGPQVSGALDVVPIGLPEPIPTFRLCDTDDAPVPARRRDAHKWSAGSVAVIGGSPGLTGAAVMAAEAALRFGAGAVRLFVPAALRAEAAAGHPGIMTAGAGSGDCFATEAADELLAAADRFDVLVVGPGMGPGQSGLVADLLAGWRGPMVLDADGLNSATVEHLASRTGPTVITPHSGEFERLTGTPASYEAAIELAGDARIVVLLKGSPTFVAGEDLWAVDSGGPELASIGTGDVLSGMVAALVARGVAPEVAARSAAHRHGLAGSALAAVTSVTAVGLLEEIGRFA